jgi:hypothetical protein
MGVVLFINFLLKSECITLVQFFSVVFSSHCKFVTHVESFGNILGTTTIVVSLLVMFCLQHSYHRLMLNTLDCFLMFENGQKAVVGHVLQNLASFSVEGSFE